LVNLVSQRFPTIERREQIPIPDALIKEVLPQGDYHLQEERRLFYVGITRAKDRLFFTAADYYGEGKREKKLSPFIFEALGDEALVSETSRQPDSKQLSFLDYSNPEVQAVQMSSRPAKLHIDYLSYSQIETFRICPLHFKLKYIYKLPTPPTSSQSFGNSFHQTMKSFYEKVSQGEMPTVDLINKTLEETWIREGYLSKSHEVGSFEKAKRFLKFYLDNYFDPKVKPVALEQPFTIQLNSLRVGGKIDRVDVQGDGLEIIDYKTGATALTQNEADKDLQLSIYGLAATSIPEYPFNQNPEKVKLSLMYFDTPQIVTTSRTKVELDEARKTIEDYKKQIEESDFKCSHSMLCENCEYKLFCRVETG
jgi:DNA helicase-2/ATP-dependent DNA helicase PcrA